MYMFEKASIGERTFIEICFKAYFQVPFTLLHFCSEQHNRRTKSALCLADNISRIGVHSSSLFCSQKW